ncbi:hypothetical protein ANCDUO_16943 [Ancylostoma duodenale]|uniref:Uncharacterized protein n=1 Tax=Ancylostoma duodenale TaxID=51022 RepID=A0A0C2CT27_9BILA|nr:hypothetical protein ANCDUO_16943 [Ancylostoma duodenale]
MESYREMVGVRVRQQGDTTIMTEHRDPYSFYWQLDQHRRRSESPKRKPPPTDYVIDEEEVIETVLSPESHDSGVAFENQYSRPLRIHPGSHITGTWTVEQSSVNHREHSIRLGEDYGVGRP